MRTTLLAATAIAGLAAAPAHAVLTINATDNGTPIVLTGCAPSNPSSSGGISCSSNDPTFSQFQITAAGFPSLPAPDLTSETIQVTSATGITTAHTLDITVSQTSITAPPGSLESTFTVNNLIGAAGIGPTTEQTQINGGPLSSETFAMGTVAETRTDFGSSASTITSDAHTYSVVFTAGDQSVNDTIQLQGVANVPEPASLAILGAGLAGLTFIRRRRS